MTTLPKRRADYRAVQDDDGNWRPIHHDDVARGLLSCEEVCWMFGDIHPATLYRGIRAGRYPAPIKVGPNISRWLLDECNAALQGMIEGRPHHA
jgi:predicted DNA-binding transcriptional regulator AlpA